MKKHTKVWLESRGYYLPNMTPEDLDVMCEWDGCGKVVDINHIDPRGMGGGKGKDVPENLIGLSRKCHNNFEAKRITKEQMFKKVEEILHNRKLGELINQEIQ